MLAPQLCSAALSMCCVQLRVNSCATACEIRVQLRVQLCLFQP